ncbi:FAD-dependent monooxygenase [Microvirga zambiensis]|uniref:FAD-dependent monooxygenase n=1 Tax=Microvirga zambiensis TaxID=1402137 RepID=UPI00191F0711|nr:FAD-dependent monooxygenase [Microvirga zambiensis]
MTDDVLIIGAGPVGLTLAIELARYNIPVRIVDKSAARTDKSKAAAIWSRSLELFDRAGCSADLIEPGNQVTSVNIMSGRKTVAHLDLSTLETAYPFSLMLPQSETERVLEEHLGRLGVTVDRSLELMGFQDDGDGVSAVLRHAVGTEETAQASWMVGCDGAHSLIREHLGLTFLGSTRSDDWILADVEVTGYPFPENELVIVWHEEGVLVFFPFKHNRYRLIARSGLSQAERRPDPTLEEFQQVVDRRLPKGIVLSNALWLSTFRINERQVNQYRSGRVFVAGDAAHIHSPAGGQGMNTGMQDAFNLAWKLALVCRGHASAPALLDSYEAERKVVGREVIEAAGRMTNMATLQNPVAQAVRDVVGHVLLGLRPVRQAMEDTFAEISIGYPSSPLNGPSVYRAGTPGVGGRIVPAKGEPPFGAGDTPKFAVLAEYGEGFDAVVDRHRDHLEPDLRFPPSDEGVWLVRPDAYVAMVAEKGDWEAIGLYLDGLRLADAP